MAGPWCAMTIKSELHGATSLQRKSEFAMRTSEQALQLSAQVGSIEFKLA
jgi:hypothetical protein